jgi:multidrug efflux system membrane fusion protein
MQTVRVRTLKAESRQADVVLRGHTEAERKVEVKAETAGVIAAVPVNEGALVKAGDVLCELEVKARTAMLNQAKARMRETQLKYEASRQLSSKGYRSETTVATDEAVFQSAKAEVQRMEEELSNTKIVAPFDGVVDRRMVEVGDYMNVGAPCALVVDEDPFLVIGQVSERDVGSLNIGDAGAARLVTGEEVVGKIRFVSKTADQATRTFRVELEVPNAERKLRDGITAEIRISVKTVRAHRISPAILALDDHGKVGVRIVENGVVAFLPVNIVADGQDGIWVTGLPESVTVITVGQEFVNAGQKVQVVEDSGGDQT